MSHVQYTMPGDPRLVDQLVYELKSKGIFDKFRKECMSDVDTRPAYQNLRQRVEGSVAGFLARTPWRPGLNKNQLREKLRKHILDGNYLEQGVERIVDQVVNPKVASVFIPQVEELVYSYLGIPRRRGAGAAGGAGVAGGAGGAARGAGGLLPPDLEAVSPGSVHSDEDNKEEQAMDTSSTDPGDKMEVDVQAKEEIKDEVTEAEKEETQLSGISDLTSHGSDSADVEHKPENKLAGYTIPKIDLAKIELPKDSDIPLPDAPMPEDNDVPAPDKDEKTFKPINSDDEDSSSDSSDLRRNMSPLTPVRNFDDENSCDAQQAFEDNPREIKHEDNKEPANFRFSIESKSDENNSDVKTEKKEAESTNLAYQFENQVNINKFATPVYEESSNSNNLQIDYESDANSKTNTEVKPPVEPEQSSQDVKKKERKSEERKSSHKSSSRSRDSRRRSESKHSRDKRDDKKPRDEHSSKSKSSSSHRDRSRDRNDKKDDRESSRQRTSSSHKSSSHRSGHRHSSRPDDKKSSSSNRDRSEKSSSKDHRSSRDSKSSHRSDKDRKSSGSSSRSKNEKDKEKKEKKEPDDHHSASGRGRARRDTDRDSNDGHSSSSKSSHNHVSSKTTDSKKENKDGSKPSSTSSGTSPSDGERRPTGGSRARDALLARRVVRVEHLDAPPPSPRLAMPEVVLKKPKFASNLQEARQMMKMRKFLDEEQRRMNQEAALLLEFQAQERPPGPRAPGPRTAPRTPCGPELEFACVNHAEDISHVDTVAQETETEHRVEDQEAQRTNTDVMSFNDEEETIESIAEIQKEVDNITNFMDTDEENSSMEADGNVTAYEIETKTDYFAQIEENNKEANTNLNDFIDKKMINDIIGVPEEMPAVEQNGELQFFGQLEKYNAELYSDQYSKFLKAFTENATRKLFLVNCDIYNENVFKMAAQELGGYDVVSLHKNGHIKLPKATIDIDFTNKEIVIPIKTEEAMKSPSECIQLLSPARSDRSLDVSGDCAGRLDDWSGDYAARLEDMLTTTSRQQVMEIILGGVIADGSPSKMPRIAICAESRIETSHKRSGDPDVELSLAGCNRRDPDNTSLASKCNGDPDMDPSLAAIKRSGDPDMDSPRTGIKRSAGGDPDNNNRQVLTPNKIRKISGSDQITSTTEETEELTNSLRSTNIISKSKYLGKARRVGLPRPRKTVHANSPSSDKSVENYEDSPPPPRRAPRAPAQRYDTSDLYKPKLHFLSRRNNVT
ncbi:biorientation of chromosomes in cell division protein 1-like 1 [Plutella xylostella]|uniref:biorientation of chromosomes in cell division protein 1-like 1 n=1 Tax=Plutella xylostella TaxID=51655 RepID=UPI0020330248|nr:biorientation of chromosomes in cell division protein 1-like 1 [Plutella xylostella]